MDVVQELDLRLGVGKSYDMCFRTLDILSKKAKVYYLNGLVDSLQTIAVLNSLFQIPHEHQFSIKLIYDYLAHQDILLEKEANIEPLYDAILQGQLVFIFEDEEEAIIVDVRKYPTRSISEPDTEKVIRGAHDGFNESLNTNIALLRRRVKDGNLRNELYSIGTKTKTNVCLSYIEDRCDKKVIASVKERIVKIETEHLIMADKALEELLIKQRFNPYPLVRYTERSDIVAVHLYQGMFALFVDTSPSVILAPATLFDHLQHTEEYRQAPLSGTYLRILRFIGVLISLFLTPIWLLFVINNQELGILNFLKPNSDASLPLILQVLIGEMGVEFLRMASIHTPSALSTAMGLIAGVLIGDIAVGVGLFSEVTVLIIAISAIGTYITPSYELGLANKITKLIFILAILIGNSFAFCIVVAIWFILLLGMKSFNKPYLSPLLPLNLKKLMKVIVRFPNKNKQGG